MVHLKAENITKKYEGEEAAPFVNGILDKIAHAEGAVK